MQNKNPKPSSNDFANDADKEKLVRAHIGWMLALARRLLRDPELAEDAVQEAFISAFRGFADFEGRAQIRTWLHRITVNACLSKLRQLKRLAEHSIDDLLPEFDQLDCRVEAHWPYLVSLNEILESDEQQTRVRRAIDELPESYRVVIQLRDIEGYSTAEVASMLEITEANVKVRLHRARSALKKLLEPILRGELAV